MSLRDKIFREVVANLLVHREYTNNIPARLIIYADRVEIDNANRPLRHGPINPEAFAPHPNNPALAKFFVQLGRMEELGSGIRNVTRYLKYYRPGAAAQFVEDDVFRTVIPVPTFDGSVAIEVVDKPSLAIPDSLAVAPKIRRRLALELGLFLSGNSLSAGEVSSILAISIRTVHRDFKLLQTAHLINPTDDAGFYKTAPSSAS